MAHTLNFFRKKHTNDIKNTVIRTRDGNKNVEEKSAREKGYLFPTPNTK